MSALRWIKEQDKLKEQIARLIWMFEAKNKQRVAEIMLRDREPEVEISAELIEIGIEHKEK